MRNCTNSCAFVCVNGNIGSHFGNWALLLTRDVDFRFAILEALLEKNTDWIFGRCDGLIKTDRSQEFWNDFEIFFDLGQKLAAFNKGLLKWLVNFQIHRVKQ